MHHGGTCSCMPCSTILKPLLFNILVVLEDDERVIGEEVELGKVGGEAGSDGETVEYAPVRSSTLHKK